MNRYIEQYAERESTAQPLVQGVDPGERLWGIGLSLLFLSLVAMPVWGALWMPQLFACVVLLLELYWTGQVCYTAICGLRSYRRLRAWGRTGWRSHYLQLGQPIQHLVVIPNYRERPETLASTLKHVAASDYPAEQISVVLGMEAREAGARDKAEVLRRQFAGRFAHFWTTVHPLRPGEASWKGANLAYSLRQIQRRCASLGWEAGRVLVTTLDADAHLHPSYLSALAVQYLTEERGRHTIFQGILVLLNNIRQVHAPIRALSAFWTFSYVAGLTHYARTPMSTYSMSLELLERINYWDPRVLVEDGHIFFRAFFALGGQVEVRPIYLTVGLDAVHARELKTALAIQYRQMVRWAWAVSNLPYVAAQCLHHAEIPWTRKVRGGLPYVETLFLLPAVWLIITLSVVLLPLLAPQSPALVFGLPLGVVSTVVLSPTILGLVACVAINLQLRRTGDAVEERRTFTRRPRRWSEWLWFPLVAGANFGGAYVQAYMRLLFGRALSDEPTPK